MSWKLALIEFLSTLGPDGKLPAELCGRQFKGIMPVLSPKASKRDADLFSERKENERKQFDTKSKQLPVLLIGSSMAYLNTDLKSWSMGTIHARSHDGCSYQILTESGLIISRNSVHLRPTKVELVVRLSASLISNVKADRPIITYSGVPALSNAVKAPNPQFY